MTVNRISSAKSLGNTRKLRLPTLQQTFTISHFRKRCGICTKLMEKTLEQVQRSSGVFIVKFEHILRLFLVFLLLT